MRTIVLILAVAGAYALLRGWSGGPGLLLRCCLAVAALVAGLAIWGARPERSHTRPRMKNMRRAGLLDYLSLGAALVFTEACFVALTSSLAGPAQELAMFTREGMAELRDGGGAGPGEDLGNDIRFDGERSGTWIFKKNLERDLPKQSNHKPTNKPEVFVELENAEDAAKLLHSRIHLRAFAFSKFNGLSWSAVPSTRIQLQSPIEFNQTNAATAEIEPIPHRIFHAVNPNGQNVFTALHGAVSTDLPVLDRLAEDIFMLPDSATPITGYNYTASSKSVHLTDLLDEDLFPALATKDELELPAAMEQQLRQTATLFQEEPDLSSRLLALRHHLQDRYTYSLETTNASGANPLENFLYQEKRGYCEHFATAAAMLCRAMGVPSRIAYGWSGGRLYRSQNMFLFRAKDAHAWTEIKLHGYGWVVFDTTPPDNDATPDSHTAPDNEPAPIPEEALAADVESTDDDDPGLATGVNYTTLLTALGVITACAIGFLVIRRWKRPQTTADGQPLRHPEPAYLLHFKQACQSLGCPMPLGRTLRQHMQSLQKLDHAPEFGDQLLAYHYGVLYGDTPKDSSEEKQLNQHIRAWKTQVTETQNSQTA
ncbi:transglutaminase domain-containing protein [Verrucomicrobiaceae bacterium 5K15]|uniref:Transglutaminase domain-containing protein n=1 Tax=Oceaniferula flava TaxID=2800421 RepID=A0AAE2SFB0_9BACT|nr:transglutaminase-like domain-containing protein [Oceaniferula flavus]MBK1855520.1 transglutaminase domain-containing protein [Oceaniferula flavus]MBM1136826.1 transglutaminase domain-containing protein [Oceaniferula flavus]